MKLLSARIIGFQSFDDSGTIVFKEGINLIVGQNNSGKSSLLRALQHDLKDDRHRAPKRWDYSVLARPEVRLSISVSGVEFENSVLVRGGDAYIPIPMESDAKDFIKNLFNEKTIDVLVCHRPNNFDIETYPGHSKFQLQGNPQYAARLTPLDGKFLFEKAETDGDSTSNIIKHLWWEKMFYFSAERMNIGISTSQPAHRLLPNAQNLPNVMSTLQGSRGDTFKKLVGHLRDIFDSVGNVSVTPRQNNEMEIRIWPTESMEREELSFSLTHSGTGVAQVLSILAAVMTVEDAVIIIDEINSFLHPAAVKTLLRILQTDYAQHQFIVSTHSAEVISYSNAQTVNLVKRDGYRSYVEGRALSDITALREVTSQLGVSMTDVFAADRIIWVEGATEEICFPWLYQSSIGQPLPRGVIFTSVVATGDFFARRRDREFVFQVYERLSQAAAPLVNAVVFSFDSEELREDEKADMKRISKGRLHFLPRRHIECYLINAEALLCFITERDSASLQMEVGVVHEKLVQIAKNDSSFVEWHGDLSDPQWLGKVDAARLLAKACAELTEQRVTFNKKHDTLALMKIVQSLAPKQLDGLVDYIRSLVKAVS